MTAPVIYPYTILPDFNRGDRVSADHADGLAYNWLAAQQGATNNPGISLIQRGTTTITPETNTYTTIGWSEVISLMDISPWSRWNATRTDYEIARINGLQSPQMPAAQTSVSVFQEVITTIATLPANGIDLAAFRYTTNVPLTGSQAIYALPHSVRVRSGNSTAARSGRQNPNRATARSVTITWMALWRLNQYADNLSLT